ncbi:unnamed protein product [Paramecium sonneborni]|uniref:Cytochrome c oxidase copper chaperone n=1 Tax=Paramecium sonneborni TaxID=65129 RepID=A0A8S1MYH6_9CILI|nr:unnamed protein product [Paramecium sonneborni]
MGSSNSKADQLISICQETRDIRNMCIFKSGENNCKKEIDKHIICMKEKGFVLQQH